MALDATVGGANANSYCLVSEADAYHAQTLNASVWTAATNGTKETALQWATRILDTEVDWAGWIVTETQALRWPRGEVYTRDGVLLSQLAIPTFLKQATAELAKSLIAGDRTAEAGSVGIAELTVDVINIVFDKSDKKTVLPPSVLAMVRPYGTALNGSGLSMVKLARV